VDQRRAVEKAEGMLEGLGKGRRRIGEDHCLRRFIDCPRTYTTFQRKRTNLDIHVACII